MHSTVSFWGSLFLGVFAFHAVGGRVASAAFVVTTQPVASKPSTTRPVSSSSVMTPEELDEHTRLITDNNTPEARVLGARKLLHSGSAEAVRKLVDILESTSSDLPAKQAVCRAIVNGDSSSFPGSSNSGENGFAPPAVLVESLLLLLGDHPDALDDLIVQALRRFERQVVIPRLQDLSADASLELAKRKAVVMALGSMGDELQAIGALMAALKEDGVRLRAAVLEALAQATGVRHESGDAALLWWESHKTMTPLQWLREVNARRVEERNRLWAEKAVLTNRLVTAYREAYLQAPEAQRPEKLRD
ncbi:MAG: HEAT repeat domain-containing protein, partial [Phycisphaerales bacterium]|nr:HEAT repeat domain-containing protein [Phycisphaerales bacterium]